MQSRLIQYASGGVLGVAFLGLTLRRNTEAEGPDKQPEVSNNKLPISVVYILGAPGAGKGTLCSKQDGVDGWKHFSVEDYLRELRDPQGTFPSAARAGLTAAEIEANMMAGKSLPPQSITEIVRWKLEQDHENGHSKFILDGFPRDKASAALFDERIAKPKAVLLIECSKASAKDRYVKRGREAADTPERFEQRYAKFDRNNRGVVERYSPILTRIDNDAQEVVRKRLEAIKADYSDVAQRSGGNSFTDASRLPGTELWP